MIPVAIDQITVHLISHDFLNEERFAFQFTRGKFRIKKWGRIRLRHELQKRNISRYIIDKPVLIVVNTFEELSQKRWEQLAGEHNLRKKRRKLLEYLQYRGWENDLIYDKVIKFK